MPSLQEKEKIVFRSQFVIWTYAWSDGIVRCCKEVQAMPITKKQKNTKRNCRIPGSNLSDAAVNYL